MSDRSGRTSSSAEPIGRSRRSVLAALGTSTSIALAGCSGGSDDLETDDSGADTGATETTAAATGPPFGSNLVAYYGFDDGQASTATDASGNGNDATIRSASRTDDDVRGQALAFDGDDDVVETPVTFADLQSGLTLSAWARADDLSRGYGWVFTQRAERDQWSQLGAHGDGSGRLRWELLVGDGIQATIDSPDGTIEEGTWHHWAGTWTQGQGLRLYIDGELIASSADQQYCYRGCSAANTGALSSAGAINLGAQGRDLEYWQGAIDEATIYDRALSASEVGRLQAFGRS